MPRWLVRLVLAAVLLAMAPAAAWGQAEGEGGGEQAPAARLSGEVTITCPWFGVGGVVRPGEWAGLRLGINDSAGKQREVLVRISMQDADGDTILYERALTTNPGVNQPLWMYVRLPYSFRQGNVLTISAYAAVEEEAGAGAGQARWAFGAGRLLGTATVPSRQVLSSTDGLIGVAGARIMGLGKYAGIPQQSYLPAGHERTDIIQRIDPDLLPDRWHGLAPISVLVWNEPPPSGLGTERAAALREWVERGGHLVIVLPRVAQTWLDEANNPLYDIMPRVRVERREGVDLTPYRQLIMDPLPGEAPPLPKNEVVQALVPLEGATAAEATCILAGMPRENGAGREWLVARRLVGTGRVDIVGLDVAGRWMTERGLPDPERFWNRILGRRGELYNEAEMRALERPGRNTLEFRNRDGPVTVDKDLPDLIAQTNSAAVGVLLGFVVFIAYWLVAGPLGYAVLRKTGQARHGWLAFAAAAGVFTAVAWGGARVIRPSEVRAQQVTLLDHVYGQPVQRARSWMSLMIPQYGEATVSVTDPSLPGGQFRNLIVPWEPDGGESSGFPDARGYRVDSRSPDRVTVPTRSTVKQFRVDWAGGPRWTMPQPLPVGSETEPQIKVGKVGTRDVIQGVLSHTMPGPLQDVVVVVNLGMKDVTDALHNPGSRAGLARVKAVALPGAWNPQEPLDLGTAVDLNARPVSGKDPTDGEAFLQQLTADLGPVDNDQTLGGKGDAARRMMAIAFFQQLEPPDIRDNQRPSHWIQRKASHGWDLSAWFAQPCVIVVGRLSGEGVSPVPPWVSTGGDAREVRTSGTTFVRWVYPLPAHPPEFSTAPRPTGEDPLPGEGGGEGGSEGDGGGR